MEDSSCSFVGKREGEGPMFQSGKMQLFVVLASGECYGTGERQASHRKAGVANAGQVEAEVQVLLKRMRGSAEFCKEATVGLSLKERPPLLTLRTSGTGQEHTLDALVTVLDRAVPEKRTLSPRRVRQGRCHSYSLRQEWHRPSSTVQVSIRVLAFDPTKEPAVTRVEANTVSGAGLDLPGPADRPGPAQTVDRLPLDPGRANVPS